MLVDVPEVDAESLAREWTLALDDAELPLEDCLLEVLRRSPTGSDDCVLLDPGTDAWRTPDAPLTGEQLSRLNSERWHDRYRVLLAPPDSRAARLGLLRDVLEHVRQHRAVPHAYVLGIPLRDALHRVYGEAGRGSASVVRLHPVWADAAAAGAALARREASGELTSALLWGPYGALFRSSWPAEDPSTLPQRMLVWAVLHREAVEAEAARCGGVEAVLAQHYADLIPAWRRLVSDVELARLARAARLSIPSRARIDAAEYTASVWDRVLDLLDRGMTLGRSILEREN